MAALVCRSVRLRGLSGEHGIRVEEEMSDHPTTLGELMQQWGKDVDEFGRYLQLHRLLFGSDDGHAPGLMERVKPESLRLDTSAVETERIYLAALRAEIGEPDEAQGQRTTRTDARPTQQTTTSREWEHKHVSGEHKHMPRSRRAPR